MTLLDSQPPPPPRHIARYVIVAAVAVAAIAVAVVALWNYPEERAVTRFLTTVESGDYQTAYRLWQPSAGYTFDDFVKDWGPSGDYGKIREFEILDTVSTTSETVTVIVSINRQTPPLKLLVDRKTKGMAYSPY
ncbi:MAG TPA: hypothetical protein VL523_11070 [Terriglobia bacterium]|nr:hypothetical protein [Terriglobia bacterium]